VKKYIAIIGMLLTTTLFALSGYIIDRDWDYYDYARVKNTWLRINNLKPATHDTYDIGTSALRWKRAYIDTLDVSQIYAMILNKGADIASAATITITAGVIHDITGTADIDSIVAGSTGQTVILQFDGTKATTGLKDGKNLKLAGDLAYTPDDVILLYYDGTYWKEISRSAN